VVLADRGGALVQVVATGIADAGMNLLDAGFRPSPVVAEFHLAAHELLSMAQALFVPLEAVQRRVERAVRERGKPGDAHVDTHRRGGLRQGLSDLALSLDRHMPPATRQADGDILHCAQRLAAVAVAQPAEFGQEDAGIGLIELDLFRVGVAEAVALPFALEAREVRPPGEEVGVGALQILERLLQWMHRPILEPRRFRPIAPCGEFLAQSGIAQLLLALLIAFLLQGERLVEHEPARAGKAAHLTLLVAIGHEFIFEGLETLHADSIVGL